MKKLIRVINRSALTFLWYLFEKICLPIDCKMMDRFKRKKRFYACFSQFHLRFFLFHVKWRIKLNCHLFIDSGFLVTTDRMSWELSLDTVIFVCFLAHFLTNWKSWTSWELRVCNHAGNDTKNRLLMRLSRLLFVKSFDFVPFLLGVNSPDDGLNCNYDRPNCH